MKKKMKKGEIAMFALIAFIVAGIVIYKPVINYLIQQSANPTGFVGRIMTRIWSASFSNMRVWTYSQIHLEDYDTILVVGFGSGGGIKFIMEQNPLATVYGVDISEESVKTATDINQDYINSGNVILSVDDVASLPFENGKFDLISAGQTHIYWDELYIGLSECYRSLADGGVFLVPCEIDKIEYHLPEYANHDDFADLLYEIGFSNVKIIKQNNYIAFIATK